MLSLCPGIQHVSAIPFSLTPAFPFNNFISIRLIRSSVHVPKQFFLYAYVTVQFPRTNSSNGLIANIDNRSWKSCYHIAARILASTLR